VLCVERIKGLNDVHPLDVTKIPGCTYCYPQVASVGLTEQAAKAAGHEVKVGRFPYVGNGKAIALGETEGMVKTVFDAVTGELLGAHMIGAEVTVVEVLDRVLPVEDEEISAFARKSFEKRGIKILTKASVEELKTAADSVTASVAVDGGKAETITAERVVLAVGIVGNVENLGIEGTKVKVEKTHVVTDPWMRTDEPGVYAIGDLVGAPWLALKASHEGVLCVERIKGLYDVHPMDVTKIPGCTYCYPQVASVGLTEQAAKAAGHEVKVGRFPYVGNGKAIALGETEGMIKTVFDATTGELLGAHMIGAEVTELIQGFVLARQMEATELDIMATIYPHPTLSEMMHESALDAYGRVIHF
jgi:dihydrolipoamide dehydrogenase